MTGPPSAVCRNRWRETVALGAVILALFFILSPIFSKAIYPAPSAILFARFQSELKEDGLPIRPDTLIAHHVGANTQIGEGQFEGAWENFIRRVGATKSAEERGCYVVTTLKGDYAVMKPIGGQRVRIVVGWPLEFPNAGVMTKEMQSGRGRRLAYRRP